MAASNAADVTWTVAAAGAATNLSVPALAEWLINDDTAVPMGATTVTSPAALASALSSASPGDTIVADPPGGALTIAHWDLPSGLNFPAGTAGNPITVMAAPNKGVVINAGEEYGATRTPNSGFWTQSGLSGADIAKKIWVSTGTFTGGSQNMIGTWEEFDHVHQIIGAQSMANLRAPTGSGDTFTNYAGPCAHQDSDGKLYIRFQRPPPEKYSVDGKWTKSLWPGHPEAVNASGELAYPVSEDPNDYVINIAKQSPGNLHFIRGGPHVWIGSGINSCGFRRFAALGMSNGAVRRGTHLCWQAVFIGTSGLTQNWDVQRARFSDGSKKHLSRAEWKFGGPLEGIRSGFILLGQNTKKLHFLNCTIADYHEITTANNKQIDVEWRWRNCTIFNILDDGNQVRAGMGRVEIGHCFYLNSALGGNSQTDFDDPSPGNWFVHHNVFDARVEKGYSWGTQPYSLTFWLNHSANHEQPHKNYNNLIFWGPDNESGHGAGLSHNYNQDNGLSAAHEVFNNIVIRHGSQRFDMTQSPSPNTDNSDQAIERINCDPDFSNEYWDFNLYYRDVPQLPGGGFKNDLMDNIREHGEVGGGQGVNQQSFNSIASFKASALFTLSQTSGTERGAYTPGFENSSTDSKPTLPSLDGFDFTSDGQRFDYRPSPTAAVTVATTSSPSGEDWWTTPPTWGDDFFGWDAGGGDLAPSNWKGALDPNGSTINIGVLNP